MSDHPPAARRLILPTLLVGGSVAVAFGSLSYAHDFHRLLTFHRVEPPLPGHALPTAAVACAVVALAFTSAGRRWWAATIAAWLIAAVPTFYVGLLVQDHLNNGPHNTDSGASGLHQIGLGLLLYAEDHGHVLPPDLPTMVRAVHIRQAAFVGCEYDGTTTDVTEPNRVATMIQSPQYDAFTYVGGGRPEDDPADTVVAFSRTIIGRTGGFVLYADGSVDWLTGEPAQHVADQARPGGPPVRWRPRPTTGP